MDYQHVLMSALLVATLASPGQAEDVDSAAGDSGIVTAFASQPLADGSSLRLVSQQSPQIVSQVAMVSDSVPDGSTWVLVAPYGWLPAMRGTVGARGVTAQVDLSLSDAVQQLENLKGAASGHVEVGKNSWGFIFDGMLVQMQPEKRLPLGGKATVDIESTLLEAVTTFRVIDTQLTAPELPRVHVDALGGARYYQSLSGVTINPAIGPPLRGEMTKDWVDLIVGGRAAITVAEGLNGFIRADFGGFGIGTSSDLAWNLIAGGEYACPSLPGSSLMLGYRVLSVDEHQKSGANEFVYDLTMQGPFAAIAYRF